MDNSVIYHQCKHSIEQARLGYLYANGGLTTEDAQDMFHVIEQVSGWFALSTLCVDDVVAAAIENGQSPSPKLVSIAWTACYRVASKWEGDEHNYARNWALEEVEAEMLIEDDETAPTAFTK